MKQSFAAVSLSLPEMKRIQRETVAVDEDERRSNAQQKYL
jgi:hypothetical protein